MINLGQSKYLWNAKHVFGIESWNLFILNPTEISFLVVKLPDVFDEACQWRHRIIFWVKKISEVSYDASDSLFPG